MLLFHPQRLAAMFLSLLITAAWQTLCRQLELCTAVWQTLCRQLELCTAVWQTLCRQLELCSIAYAKT